MLINMLAPKGKMPTRAKAQTLKRCAPKPAITTIYTAVKTQTSREMHLKSKKEANIKFCLCICLMSAFLLLLMFCP